MIASFWNVDQTKILTRRELACVLQDLASKAFRSASTRMNLTIFRLSCCCGLRVSETGALRLEDVCLGSGRPHLKVRPEGAKGKKARVVPLWWDAATLADIRPGGKNEKSKGLDRAILSSAACGRAVSGSA